MAYLRVRRQRRGYAEIGRKIRFLKRVEFMQGQGLTLPRSEQFHVDGKDGSDNHNGLSFDRAFKTIAAAITAMAGLIGQSHRGPGLMFSTLHLDYTQRNLHRYLMVVA